MPKAPRKPLAGTRLKTIARILTSSPPSSRRVTAVVLAGGASQRFPPDKLAAEVEGRRLLDRALTSLPERATVIVVGSVRDVIRPVIFTSEDPPGGGPAAGLVAGVRRALAASADAIVVLPADAPLGGQAARILLSRLDAESSAEAAASFLQLGYRKVLHRAHAVQACARQHRALLE